MLYCFIVSDVLEDFSVTEVGTKRRLKKSCSTVIFSTTMTPFQRCQWKARCDAAVPITEIVRLF